MMKRFILFLLIFPLAYGGFHFWSQQKDQTKGESKAEKKYKEYRVERGMFQMIVSADGVVQPIKRIEIKSKASGQIKALPIEEGAFVRRGVLIAKLDQQDEETAVALAQAELDIAKAEHKQSRRMFIRRKELFRKKIISEEEQDQIGLQLAISKGKVIQSKTALDRARERLGDAIVRAPISGMILQKYVEEGQIISSGVSNVSGGTPIADIANMQTVHIEAGIDEIDIGQIKIGQDARVQAEAYPDLSFSGKIIRISPEAKIEQNVTLFDVVIKVENKDNKLKSGMNTGIQITIVEKKDVLLLPVAALRISEPGNSKGENSKNKTEVLLKAGTQFSPLEITSGLSDFKNVEVLTGLSEGDIVGVVMTSRLKADNDRLEERMKSGRRFGGGKSKKK